MNRCLAFCALAACGPAVAPPSSFEVSDAEAEQRALETALDRGEERRVVILMRERQSAAREEASAVTAVTLRDRASLQKLKDDPNVERVEADRPHDLTASASLEMIRQPVALSRGATGAGSAVAIFDTGVNYLHTDFGCTALGAPSACAVTFARDFAPEDGLLDAMGHGSNVAGIVHSVAPAAKILALDVFNGSSAWTSDISTAIDWAIRNRDAYGIVAANFSLGYGTFAQPCGTDVLALLMERLRAAGIAPVVASGNAGATSAISSPACGPSAFSVGAVDAGSGAIATFSNSASFLSLLAPGVYVTAGGYTMSGTSMAAPHVAGAFAALHTRMPSMSPDQLLAVLKTSGKKVEDPRNHLTFPQIDLAAATADVDITAPTLTLSLPSYAKEPAVRYTLEARDDVGVVDMCVTTAATCSTFVAFASSGAITLPKGDGEKTVRAWVRDREGNVSAAATDTIILDMKAPKDGAVTATAGIRSVTLSWSGFLDTGSGIASYFVYGGTTPPATCAAAGVAPLASTSQLSFTHAGLTAGATYRYRVCAVDNAGRSSSGRLVSATPVTELDPPTQGRLVLAGGAAWTKTAIVPAAVHAEDASGVAMMCLSATSECKAWVRYAEQTTAKVATGTGARRVTAWFKDTQGNVGAPVSADINIDTVAPPETRVTATRTAVLATLSFGAVTDTGSGFASYVLAVSSDGRAPASCATGSVVSTLTAQALAVAGKTFGYRVCTRDLAGNTSRGVTGLLQ